MFRSGRDAHPRYSPDLRGSQPPLTGQRVRLSLSGFSLPMLKLEAEFTIAPAADGLTETTFLIAYRMKYGLLGRLMGAVAVRRQLRQLTGKVLAGLNHHAATGEIVGKDFVAGAS